MLSKKLREKIDRLRYVGFFTPQIAQAKELRHVVGKEGRLHLHWLVDESDGVIADAKFQVFGPVGLIAAAEVASELVLHKNYDQVSRLTADLIDRHVRDRKEEPAFPKECGGFLNQVLSAIDNAVQQCIDIPFAATYDMTPIENDFGEIPGGIPGWIEFPLGQKLKIVEEVLEKEIRPYIELDAGGVQLIELKESGEVLIAYEGACTSCHSATGSTLTAIQRILRARVHPSLFVTPTL
ncbi:MAG: NifU family protein [Verrucomicrobia bacterium]|nr:NifU family protein [Verrucomicrobiota bacterium]MBU6446982.1 NifU family protein [Verrucomicrobiota bacterium]MDE3048051.1 NifU family protein [Verrucomicrobiota bacterium]